MADVFISYSREDRARSDQIAQALQQAGVDVFWDNEIPPGQTWADYIEDKLVGCKAVLVLWSAASTRSQWVREEARMGRDKSKLIPVLLDDSPAPFGFGEVQADNLKDWNGQPNHPDWERTLAAVKRAVSQPGAPAVSAPPPPQPRIQPVAAPVSAAPPRQQQQQSSEKKKAWWQSPWAIAGGAVVATIVVLGVIGSMNRNPSGMSGPGIGGQTAVNPPPPAVPTQQPPQPTPQSPPSSNAPGEYNGQLQAQLNQAQNFLTGQGFQPIGQAYNTSLQPGARQDVPITLDSNIEYRIIAVCDDDCTDLDLILFDQNSNQVTQDVALDDHPILTVQPAWTGGFRLQLVMATCNVAPCYVAAQLYGRRKN